MLLSMPMIRILLLAIALASTIVAAAPREEASPPAVDVPVVMYATAWCPYCAQARAYFKSNGIPYTEFDVEKSPTARAEFKKLGGRAVPLILVGRERVDGFSELAFEFALQKASR
jgi:glutaredoxin